MSSSTSRRGWSEGRRQLALITGLLAGPVVWLALLETVYALSYRSCEARRTWFLHVALVAGAVIVAAAGWWASRAGAAVPDGTSPALGDDRESRERWMAVAGVITSAWFVLVIAAMEIPIAVLEACT